MELSFLILQQIVSMFLMIMVGFVLVRIKVFSKDMGSYLSKVVLYIVLPCTIVNAFQIEYSNEVAQGLLYAFVVALVANCILIFAPYLFRRFLKLNALEQASWSYPNSGDILIPLVASVLSKDMQVYCCAFLIVQMIFIFTHGVVIISGQKNISWKSIVKNVNVIAIFVGFLLFILNIQLPAMLAKTINSFADMVAPLCMLVIGCAIGNSKIEERLKDARIYGVVLLRQVITPIVFLILFKITGVAGLIEEGKAILLIVFMAIASSPAATVTNLAQGYDQDAEQASMINLVGVILLIITMPAMVYLYQIFI